MNIIYSKDTYITSRTCKKKNNVWNIYIRGRENVWKQKSDEESLWWKENVKKSTQNQQRKKKAYLLWSGSGSTIYLIHTWEVICTHFDFGSAPFLWGSLSFVGVSSFLLSYTFPCLLVPSFCFFFFFFLKYFFFLKQIFF